jgi:hypothetical protein
MDLRDPATRVKVFQCLSSKEWRMRNLYYVKDKEGRKVLFIPNAAQEAFLKEQHGLDIILKARQQGFTTLSCISFLDDCLFTANFSAGIIAHNLEDAHSFFNDKIKFAYDCLPNDIKQVIKANTDKAGELSFSNGSRIRVRTSFRSGTLQRLHISEFGKICAKSPEKAREIVTGAMNAIATGLQVIIESTAEGQEGYFFDMCETGRTLARSGAKLSKMDIKFHFFPWWHSPEYRLDPVGVVIPQRLEEYFKSLEKDFGIKLDPSQKAWYVKKEMIMADDMGREFPSHPDEAFAQSVEGAYYGQQMAMAETQGRIGNVPHEPLLKVHVLWDLGMDDSMTLWFVQVDNFGNRRFINYYENSGEGLEHYARYLFSLPYTYGKMVLPHDAKVRELGTGVSRAEKLYELGLRDQVIAPSMTIMEGINAVRALLPKCWFDQAKCADGIKSLKYYRKDWDDKAGCWKERPRHDKYSHGADSFRMGAIVDLIELPRPTQRHAKNKYR